MPTTRILTLAPLWAVLIWSGNAIVTKAAATVIDPASIALYRWVLALFLLLPLFGRALWAKRQVVIENLPKLAVLGGLGMAIYQGLAYEAATSTSAINMGVILALAPLMSAFFSSLLAAEPISRMRLFGGLISLTGVVVLTTGGQPWRLADGNFHLGDALMLAAVSGNAIYSALVKRWAMPLSTWEQLLAQVGFGVLFLLPFWLLGPKAAITAANLPLVLYAGVLASIGAPFFGISGVRQWGASRAALFLNLLPVLVAFSAWGLLGEHLAWYHALGGAIVLTGVALGLQKRQVSSNAICRE